MPISLCLMPTFACPARCRHCGTLSSPDAKGRLALAQQLEAIRQASEAGYEEVVFSGGEPSLAGDDLFAAMHAAVALGMRVRIVSNAHWATNLDVARKFAAALAGAGLAHATLSTGDEHSRFIPVANVLTAARALADRGIEVSIVVEATAARRHNSTNIESSSEFAALVRDYPDASVTIQDGVWSALSPYRALPYASGDTVNSQNLHTRGGCAELFRTTTIQADGVISPCCGLGIRTTDDLRLGEFGSISLTEADTAARTDPLKRWIAVAGPERILAAAGRKDTAIRWENQYAHRCQACVRIFRDPQVRRAAQACVPEHETEIAFLETVVEPAEKLIEG